MNLWPELLFAFIVLSTLAYLLLVMLMRRGWLKGKPVPQREAAPQSSISVVMAARNEANRLSWGASGRNGATKS